MKTSSKLKSTDIGLIPKSWKVINVRDVTEQIFSGGTPDTRKPEYWNGDINWLSSGETGNKFIQSTERKITKYGVENSSTRLAMKNDIVIASAGQGYTRGQVSFNLIDTYVNQSVVVLRSKKKIIFPLFLFYYLSSRYEQLRQISDAHSSRGSLTTKLLADLSIPLPSCSEQEKISQILYDLDSKISLNTQMNRILVSISQSIFKHWFVDFEFPNERGRPYKSSGGKMVYNEELRKDIPEGWTVKPIDEIAEFLNGIACQKYPAKRESEFLPVIKIRELRQGISEDSDKADIDVPKEYLVDDGDVLFSWSGSLEVKIWTNGRGILNQHLFKVSSKEFPKWFYYYWTLQYLPEYRHIAEGKATTMGHIQRSHLKNSLVIIPKNNTLLLMDSVISPIISKVINNGIEIRHLIQVRDFLLPKLMSGKIRVPIQVTTKNKTT